MSERFSTYFTQKWPLTCMASKMAFHVEIIGETFATKLASYRLDIAMDILVTCQMCFLFETLATNMAGMRALF